MTIPSISVLITTKNRVVRLDDCLHSLEEQTCQDFEVIIVNDFSEDKTEDFLKNYQGIPWSRLNIINAIEPLGRNKAITIAQECAQGDYSIWLDDDDFLHPTALEKLLRFAQEDNKQIVYAGHQAVKEDGEIVSSRRKKGINLNLNDFRLVEYFYCFHPRLYCTSLTYQAWINRDLKSALDYDLMLRLNEIAPIHFLDELLYYYSVTPTGRMSCNVQLQRMSAQIAQLTALSRRGITGYTVNSINQVKPIHARRPKKTY